jgi:hypothetical protein
MTTKTKLAQSAAALEVAIQGQTALDWLMSFDPSEESGADNTAIEIRPHLGSGVEGAAEARAYLQRAARDLLPEIVNRAKFLATQDVEPGIRIISTAPDA